MITYISLKRHDHWTQLEATSDVPHLQPFSELVECVPKDAEYIGLHLGVFKACSDPYDSLVLAAENLQSAARQIRDVLNTSPSHNATARGQLHDAGADTRTLSNLDISILDVYVREGLAEAAREVDNPFENEPPVPLDIIHIVNNYNGEEKHRGGAK